MKGEYFKEIRIKRNLTKEELAKILKISEAQIDLIEKGEVNKLPHFVAKEILKRYKNFFKIPDEKIKEIIDASYQQQSNETIKFKRNFNLSFRNIFIWTVFLFLIIFLIYQFLSIVSPPKIKVIYPPNNFYSYEKQITIKGYVEKNSTFFINKDQVFPDKNGYFEKLVVLRPGINKFILEAINYFGIKNKKVLQIYYVKFKY